MNVLNAGYWIVGRLDSKFGYEILSKRMSMNIFRIIIVEQPTHPIQQVYTYVFITLAFDLSLNCIAHSSLTQQKQPNEG